jgi:uncharacterized protein YodC (DUF2158 family)
MQRGDIVLCRKSGTKMTVYAVLRDLPQEQQQEYLNRGYRLDDVICAWFVGVTLKKQAFLQAELINLVELDDEDSNTRRAAETSKIHNERPQKEQELRHRTRLSAEPSVAAR